MSLYDDFRAPRYVDFANPHHDGPDRSTFFDHDTENVLGVSSSASQSSADFTLTPGSTTVDARDLPSSADDTLVDEVFVKSPRSSTPMTDSKGSVRSAQTHVRFMSPKNSLTSPTCSTQKKNLSMEVADSHKSSIVSPLTMACGVSSTPLDCSPGSKMIRDVAKGGTTPVRGQKVKSDRLSVRINSQVRSTPKFVNQKVPEICINVIPPTPNNTVIEEPCAFDKSTPKAVISENRTDQQRSHSAKAVPANRSRSRSSSNVKNQPLDDDTILQNALKTLRLSCAGSSSDVQGNDFPSPQDVAKCASQVSICEKNVAADKNRPKRRLSPVQRDYSRQPEKFISLAEHVAKAEKQTPTRFRTLPRADALRKTLQSKVAKSAFPTSKERKVLKSSCKQNDQDQQSNAATVKESNEMGVKKARWAAPKVEPFKLTEYKKKELLPLPRTVFDFSTRHNVLLRDRRTPIKRIRPPTKPEPFSFDSRDQDLLRRKRERMNGELDPQAHCCRGNRRRSKSQSDVMCKETGENLVHHARIPVVLYKPPFKPQKAPQKPTKAIGFHLNTEKRAKEREVFDEHVRRKEDERQAQLQMLAERKRQEEEKEIAKWRKECVHKAHPMPVYHTFTVKPSNARLTDPHTPEFMHRSHNGHNHKAGVPADDPMDC
ncbi:hypothetical protein ONE63_006551 [Megalurothrips usitatus]|uniref:TPX2 C-terminal domain-containing protein n=1 Tax=Megalurothrips usitatus TaxID=439358 RepID=A0AAV7Y144_9NEOP|nr:hypothetical protein ONE63_006551 [Megalurothrips usitatus]